MGLHACLERQWLDDMPIAAANDMAACKCADPDDEVCSLDIFTDGSIQTSATWPPVAVRDGWCCAVFATTATQSYVYLGCLAGRVLLQPVVAMSGLTRPTSPAAELISM